MHLLLPSCCFAHPLPPPLHTHVPRKTQTIQLLEDTMTRFRNYGCRFDGKGMSQSWKHRLQQLSGGFTLYASVDPQLVTLNQVTQPSVTLNFAQMQVGGIELKFFFPARSALCALTNSSGAWWPQHSPY